MEIKLCKVILDFTNCQCCYNFSRSNWEWEWYITWTNYIANHICHISRCMISKIIIWLTTHIEIIYTKIIHSLTYLEIHQHRKTFKGILDICCYIFSKVHTITLTKWSTYLIYKLTNRCVVCMCGVSNICLYSPHTFRKKSLWIIFVIIRWH